MSKIRMLSITSLICFLAVCFIGCQTSIPIAVDKDRIEKPSTPPDVTLTLLSKAKDVRPQDQNQVGRHTISLLMIPGPKVESGKEELSAAIVNRTFETLTSLGYNVRLVDKLEEAKGPVLVLQMDQLRNYLFSWTYPLGLTWGKMELSLHLMTPDAREVWKTNLEGSSGVVPSFLYMSGFESRVTSDLTENMNQLIRVVSSPEFKEQLRKAQAYTR